MGVNQIHQIFGLWFSLTKFAVFLNVFSTKFIATEIIELIYKYLTLVIVPSKGYKKWIFSLINTDDGGPPYKRPDDRVINVKDDRLMSVCTAGIPQIFNVEWNGFGVTLYFWTQKNKVSIHFYETDSAEYMCSNYRLIYKISNINTNKQIFDELYLMKFNKYQYSSTRYDWEWDIHKATSLQIVLLIQTYDVYNQDDIPFLISMSNHYSVPILLSNHVARWMQHQDEDEDEEYDDMPPLIDEDEDEDGKYVD